jgi:hypothetical protein
MSTVDEIERAVSGLSPEDLARFRAWWEEFEEARFDAQLEADSLEGGPLSKLAEEALAEHRAGRTRKL